MNYTISKDRKTLTIFVDAEERQELRVIRECGGDCQCDVSMHDFLEPITANSELEWISPADTHDLTDAPTLGILDEAQPLANEASFAPHYGTTLAGCYGSPPQIHVHPILERWGYMNYALRSPLEDLRDKGEAVFIGGAP